MDISKFDVESFKNLIRIEKKQPQLEWTTEPPTKKGWYWVITNDLGWGNPPECVYIGCPEYDDILHVYGINPMHQIEPVTDYHNNYTRHWYGPVEPPARPKK